MVRGENSRGLNITYSRSTRGVLIFQPTKIIFFRFKSCEQFLATSLAVRFSMFIEVGGF